MLEPPERRFRPSHAISRFEQRLIVRSAVVRHQRVELGQVLGQTMQETRLLRRFTHEELPQPKTLWGNPAYSNKESVRACSARETGSFGVEKRPSLRMCRGCSTSRQRIQQIVRQIVQRRDVEVPVPPVPFPDPLRLKVRAVRRGNLFARKPLLDKILRGTERWRKRGRHHRPGIRVLAVHPSDSSPKLCELFLNVLHFAVSLPVYYHWPAACLNFLVLRPS